MTTDPHRFAAECLAVADSLRSIRQQLNRKLMFTDEIAPETVPSVQTILVLGLDVATSLEAMATRLGEVY